METTYSILGIIIAAFMIFYIYRLAKNRPELFTKENFTKSFFSMGVLGMILIVFVALLVLFVRSS